MLIFVLLRKDEDLHGGLITRTFYLAGFCHLPDAPSKQGLDLTWNWFRLSLPIQLLGEHSKIRSSLGIKNNYGRPSECTPLKC